MHVAKAFEKIIRLNKKIAEANYKINYLKKIGQNPTELMEEVGNLRKEREKLLGVLKEFNIEFFIPFQNDLEEFNNKLSKFTVEQINIAMKKKQGSAWDLLKGRAAIIKNNLFHAEQIGKLAEALLMVNEEKRKRIIEFIKKGKVEEDVEVDEEIGLRIARYLHRLGIDARYKNGLLIGEKFPFKEVGIRIGEKVIYVPEEKVESIAENEQRLREITIKIQLKNAEKQIKSFSKGEEEDFERLQKKYLELLKKREEYLKKYAD